MAYWIAMDQRVWSRAQTPLLVQSAVLAAEYGLRASRPAVLAILARYRTLAAEG
jgi:hypothetical protein